jgi:hypothetical protein
VALVLGIPSTQFLSGVKDCHDLQDYGLVSLDWAIALGGWSAGGDRIGSACNNIASNHNGIVEVTIEC